MKRKRGRPPTRPPGTIRWQYYLTPAEIRAVKKLVAAMRAKT